MVIYERHQNGTNICKNLCFSGVLAVAHQTQVHSGNDSTDLEARVHLASSRSVTEICSSLLRLP